MRAPRATKEQVTAPPSKFRVLGLDLRDGTGALYFVGDYDSLDSAKEVAAQRATTGSPTFIYNDQAELIVRYGSWH